LAFIGIAVNLEIEKSIIPFFPTTQTQFSFNTVKAHNLLSKNSNIERLLSSTKDKSTQSNTSDISLSIRDNIA